jgi:O-antigen/teichoic acid export membrane protein
MHESSHFRSPPPGTTMHRDSAVEGGRFFAHGSLSHNAIVNVVGHGLPLMAAIIAIPLLIGHLGTERFGVLTLLWVAIGYSAVIDFGVGRAVTHTAAKLRATGSQGDLGTLLWTGLVVVACLGTAVGAVLFALSLFWTIPVGVIDPGLEQEIRSAVLLLCLFLPVVAIASVPRGILEAQQQFVAINAIQLPMTMISYFGPILLLPLTTSLIPITLLLLVGRAILSAVSIALCLRSFPTDGKTIRIKLSVGVSLLRFGRWITVSNTIGPIMIYADRFMIGAMLSATAVTFYVTPLEVVTKLWIVPLGVFGVLFPAIAESASRNNSHASTLYYQGLRFVAIILFPPVLAAVTFAPELLGFWLGGEFKQESALVLQILAIGVFMNSLGHAPYAFLHGIGRPDVPAQLHLIELPIFLLALAWLISMFGIMGAAIAWTGRLTAEALVLYFLARRHVHREIVERRGIAVYAVTAFATLLLACSLPAGLTKPVFLVTVLLLFLLFAWQSLLTPVERRMVKWTVRYPRGQSASIH